MKVKTFYKDFLTEIKMPVADMKCEYQKILFKSDLRMNLYDASTTRAFIHVINNLNENNTANTLLKDIGRQSKYTYLYLCGYEPELYLNEIQLKKERIEMFFSSETRISLKFRFIEIEFDSDEEFKEFKSMLTEETLLSDN